MAAPMPPAPPVTTATGLADRMVDGLVPTVPPHPQVGLFLMTGKSLQFTKPRTIAADQHTGRVGCYALVRAGLDELADPQAPGVARCAHRRQGVIGADDFVAERDIGARAQKQRAE